MPARSGRKSVTRAPTFGGGMEASCLGIASPYGPALGILGADAAGFPYFTASGLTTPDSRPSVHYGCTLRLRLYPRSDVMAKQGRPARGDREPTLPDSELEVMRMLWKYQKATARQVWSNLSEEGSKWTYATVNTLLQRL